MEISNRSETSFTLPAPELQFLASTNHIYDYEHLYGFTEILKRELSDITFSKKEPLLIISHSSDEQVFLIAAAFLLNVPVMLIHPESSGSDLNHILKQVEPKLVYSDQESMPDSLKDLQRLNIDSSWLSLTTKADSELLGDPNPDSICGLFLTSGSSGFPKIVPIKRRQAFSAANSSAQNFKTGKNKYWLLCLPLNHIGGVSIIYRSLIYHSAIFRMDRFDADQANIFLSENPLFEVASLVPTMLLRMLEDPMFRVHRSFKAILLGGGPIPNDLINQSITRGIPLVLSYGMTETCAQIAANSLLSPSGTYTPKSSVGPIFKPNQIEIRDDSGQSVPKREEGQIWLKGPQIFDGYLDSTLDKKQFDKDGWFHTGDFGHINRNDQLFIKSRRTDLIITGGENVNPYIVEDELIKHNDITECAVLGVNDDKWGQKIVALYVSNNENINETDLKEMLKRQIRNFQVPKEFIRVDNLPKTALGKIKRGDLKLTYDNHTG